MSESVLKKQFSERDIQRVRNLVKGNFTEKTVTGVGYSKIEDLHKEGDVWEDVNGTWTIKDGLRQKVTKMDKIKNKILFPLFCPNCKSKMNERLDKPYFKIHNHCFNCQINFEAKLKLEGKYEQYEIDVHNDHINKLIEEYTAWYNDHRVSRNESFVTEDGKVERWVGGNNDLLDDEYVKTIEWFKSQLK